MRLCMSLSAVGLMMGLAFAAQAEPMPGGPESDKNTAPKQVEVTADGSLEWYQDQNIYVARGNAKAVRGDMVVEADLLTAHEREKSQNGKNAAGDKSTAAASAPAPQPAKPKAAAKGNDNGTGDIDKMTAEGNVRITDPRQRVVGDHAVYDLDQHVAVVTGKHLKYETEQEIITARDSMEYWEERKMAVARGNAVADKGDRHVEGDMLTAEFRDEPNGGQALWKMTAMGHVTVITKGNVSRGDQAVYDVSRDIAILHGNVHITRADGTQLTGDVGEVDFTNNQSRLMNAGGGRVRALLSAKSTNKAGSSNGGAKPTKAAKPGSSSATSPMSDDSGDSN